MSSNTSSLEFPADEQTPRCSVTGMFANGHPDIDPHKPSSFNQDVPLSPSLTREVERDQYGWDDPQDPPQLKPTTTSKPVLVSEDLPITWDGPDDPKNPHNWSIQLRWWYTIVSVLMAVAVTYASSAPTVTLLEIQREYNVSAEISYLITTVFLLGYVFGPTFWGPGSELVGRRPVFMLSLSAFTVFHLGQALAPNIETLLITRFCGGFFAAAPLTNAPGLIADMWPANIRSNAVSLFTVGVFLGPVLGPIVSSFIVSSNASWHWVYWVMMIFAGVCTGIAVVALPETYAPVLLQRKARQMREEDPIKNAHIYAEHEREDWSLRGILHRTVFRPFQMLLLEPILVLITIYMSLVYGLLYALFSAFPIIWGVTRHFTVWQSSLIFIGVGIGASIGSYINLLTSRHYPALMKKWRGFPPPEERLYGGMIAGPLLVIGAFWLGWTGHYASIPWYVPAIATVFIGVGIALIFMSFLGYLVDTYLLYSASAVAANTMIRSVAAAAFPLFTVQMFEKLGINWACTLIGLLSLLLTPSAFLFYKYGPKIRERSKFAPCMDLKIAKELKEAENHPEKAETV